MGGKEGEKERGWQMGRVVASAASFSDACEGIIDEAGLSTFGHDGYGWLDVVLLCVRLFSEGSVDCAPPQRRPCWRYPVPLRDT
jgi:hypothetical protein